MKITGPAWTFGNNVDTDQITPGHYMDLPIEEMSKHVFEPIAPEFVSDFKAGGIIVGGSNFGCGSSRETAPDALKFLGVAAIVAESFARIFFRNAIAIGLPVLVCPGIASAVSMGDELEVDFEAARVTNLSTKKQFQATPLHHIMVESLKKGGIMKMLADT
ncbi:MAG: 3-isopropylmalate dehydratase small subunit [Candidatus Abyssobacteria bacterium SURF_17]|uniref:3-isopropylmalate dehydratase n=1 Tax=Candidatus Abyssobacteria bacterium SURF_17 TaxID=2093361 RepID=A0A419EUU4_9BACT|nr:MAG: 3-isopropylmalate dehydratase small subunit [Candidatus Abyssubacteria bacterium SURF_17]